MAKKIIKTDQAPAAIGPYNQGIIANGFVFTAGQIPLDPATGQIVGNDIQTQARQSLRNLQNVLEAGGAGLRDVVKVTVFLQDLKDFAAMNQIYAEFFGDECPARSAVQVARLPKDALVEVEAVAVLPG